MIVCNFPFPYYPFLLSLPNAFSFIRMAKRVLIHPTWCYGKKLVYYSMYSRFRAFLTVLEKEEKHYNKSSMYVRKNKKKNEKRKKMFIIVIIHGHVFSSSPHEYIRNVCAYIPHWISISISNCSFPMILFSKYSPSRLRLQRNQEKIH